ncbi:MAG: PepSY domain-containing protein [Methylobacteriaceae bacterium]|nr:PepSY domain-containing protein [Methylobacteriaceae bacterium]
MRSAASLLCASVLAALAATAPFPVAGADGKPIVETRGGEGRGGEHRPVESCLSSGDTLEIVSAKQVVAPGAAIVLAREAVPNADVLRASLCRDEDELVYRITVLRHDGRVVRVTVDAPSGKVKTVH